MFLAQDLPGWREIDASISLSPLYEVGRCDPLG